MIYHPYDGLLCHEKEAGTDTCHHMDEPWKHYVKWNKPLHRKTDIIWFHLCELYRRVKFIETRSRFDVTRVVGMRS